jgi:hypothetical protein
MIDVEQAIKLVNNRKTTVEDVCALIQADINKFQEEREKKYLSDLADNVKEKVTSKNTNELAEKYSEKIYQKIKKDIKEFCIKYANESIDSILDAMNQKRFRYKKGPINVLVLLSSLKELNETA